MNLLSYLAFTCGPFSKEKFDNQWSSSVENVRVGTKRRYFNLFSMI